MGYEYDAFFSYKRDVQSDGWHQTVKEKLEFWLKLELNQSAVSRLPAIHDRAQDIWRPLLAIADVVGDDWPERARTAALTLSGPVASPNGMALHLLRDVRQIFHQRQAERLPSRDMVRELGRMENRPWSQWKHTKPITAIQLARILADLGVAPKVIRHGPERGSPRLPAAGYPCGRACR
jgi:hypothetical protein